MGKYVRNGPNTELERQQLLDELATEHGSHWAAQYTPGSFGCHELLDRTALAVDMVEGYIRTHPACIEKREWFALAEQAVAALQELYQRIGAAHLDDK